LFERFEDAARKVVVFAQDEARLLNHNYIGTEHLLLGLLAEGKGAAAQTLAALRIELPAVRARVEQIIGRGPQPVAGHLPFTPRAKKVLELAMREAMHPEARPIGTEHILLGLVREGEGVAMQILQEYGLTDGQIRSVILRVLDGTRAEEASRQVLAPSEAGPSWVAGPSCSWCSRPLEDTLMYRTLSVPGAEAEAEPIPLVVLFCRACGGLVRTSQD
jgi:ATP-dependent Clp protease ATP-binding subunit ClpC